MQELQSALVPGVLVHARGERWTVRDARRFADGAFVTLDAAEPATAAQTTTLLLPFDRIEPVAAGPPTRRRRDRVVRAAIDALAGTCPDGGLSTARTARIDLLPWQLAPALAVLGGATRLLLADAVGLGKTIQAGLILAELSARGLATRALILAPPALRADWTAELTARFDLAVTVLDLPAILEFESTRGIGLNPWSGTPVIVSSVDLVKRADVLLAVECAPLDLLIVDEVHHATPGTDRYAAIHRLARQVPWVVLLSATPHSGDVAAYRALLAVGEVGTTPIDRLQVFRRSHRDVRLGIARRTHILKVRPSDAEERLHAAVLAYVRDLCRSPSGTANGVLLLAGVLARRATSSPLAILRTLRRRLAGLSDNQPSADPASPALPWEELDEEDGESWLSLAGLADPATERDRLGELIRLAEAAAPRWSKGLRLLRLVRSTAEPLIVFTEFRDSLDACRTLLEPEATMVCLHGGVDAGERRARVGRFVDGRARVLLATDVAGEGLNLQAASRLVVTLEWPWNPLRLEQRVGRVHRLGQGRTVHAIHLTARDSYEDTVVAKALGRTARAAADLAETAAPFDPTVAAEILGLAANGSGAELPDAPADDNQITAGREAARIARLRHWAHLGRPIPGGATAWAWPRRGSGAARLLAIVEVRRTSAGAPTSCHVVSIDITLRTRPSDRRQWAMVCRSVAADSRVRAAAIEATAPVVPGDRWAGPRARLAAIRLDRRQRKLPGVQPSLFDRRAVREAQSVESACRAWDERQAQLEQRLEASREPPIITTRLVALLPIGEGSIGDGPP